MSSSPTSASCRACLVCRRCPVAAQHLQRTGHDVLQSGHVAEQVELLKHHADLAPLLRQDCIGHRNHTAIAGAIAEKLAVDAHPTLIRRIEMVEAAQERALAAAAGADDHHHLALAHVQIDAAQHVMIGEILVDAFSLHHQAGGVRWRHATAPPGSGRVSLSAAPARASGPMQSPSARNAPPAAAARSPTAW